MVMIGYARVSTADQDLEGQRAQLAGAGCARVFAEHASGVAAARPQLAAALDYARAGDVLVVVRLDRLGRSMHELVALLDELGRAGIAFRSLSEGLATDGAAGQLVLHVLAAFAQFERALIRERTRDGLQAARANGRRPGRARALSPAQEAHACELLDAGRCVSEVARVLGVGRATVYRVRERQQERLRAQGSYYVNASDVEKGQVVQVERDHAQEGLR